MSDAVLLIDDDANALRAMGTAMEQVGAEVVRELDGLAGLAACDRIDPDVAVIDAGVSLPDGRDLLDRLIQCGVPVVVLLDAADEDAEVQALRRGATVAMVRPADPGLVAAVASRLAALTRRRRAALQVLGGEGAAARLDGLGGAGVMRAVVEQLTGLARSDRSTVLILGEPGVGKGWVARLIHDLGPRSGEPFLEASALGHTPMALESLLFGHERGAVPEARRRRRGLLEVAHRGTVLLREVHNLPTELQPLLMRAIEAGTLRRLGGQRDVAVLSRLIVSSSRNLEADVEAQGFRGDLLHRLSTVVLTIPPLRDRSEADRLLLIHAVYAGLAASAPEPLPPLAPETIERLLQYPWPGNVRELRNVLERAILLARWQPALLVEHLAGELRARPGLGDRRHSPMSLDELERLHIDRTLRFHGGNRTRAAKELQISRATLINKIKRYEIAE